MESNQLPNEHKWNERNLIGRLCHALDIAALTVEHLAPNGFSYGNNQAKSIRPEKVISETAILLIAASAVAGHSEIATRVDKLAERLIPHARNQRAMLGLCMEPTVAWDYALPHVCLSRLGYRDSAFDELLRETLKSEAHAGRERVPHRVLEQEWLARMWAEPKSFPRSATPDTARLSILNHPMDLINGTRDDIYAFTHALMYVSDFGFCGGPLPRPRAVILEEAEAMLARSLDDQDYDLSGELLLSWPLTGKSWSAASAFAFRVLARVEDQATFLPTPSTRISELNALSGVERTRYLLATAYHTAFVMGLLCAASLQPGCAPPTSIESETFVPGAAHDLWKLLDDDKSSHWCDEFQQLSEPEKDSLATFLINIALRRKVARREFSKIPEILDLAYDLNIAFTPSVSQSAEMLDRFIIYDKLTRNPAAVAGPRSLQHLAALPEMAT